MRGCLPEVRAMPLALLLRQTSDTHHYRPRQPGSLCSSCFLSRLGDGLRHFSETDRLDTGIQPLASLCPFGMAGHGDDDQGIQVRYRLLSAVAARDR